MSDAVTLTLRGDLPDGPIDASSVVPDRLADLDAAAIAALPAWAGASGARLGDFFDVDGERAARVRVVGATSRLDGLGAGMTSGELLVDGDAGQLVGSGMSGGSIEVRGRVGDGAGSAMSGGTLRVTGDAGARLGAAGAGAAKGMTGGEIIVGGSAGPEAAARARRGLVVVGGDAGERAGRAMIAGSLIVLGRVHGEAGVGNKRGSVVAVGGVTVPPTYLYACTYAPPHLRFTFTYLRRRHALAVDERVVSGLYRRWCGDAGDGARGEILAWSTE